MRIESEKTITIRVSGEEVATLRVMLQIVLNGVDADIQPTTYQFAQELQAAILGEV